MGDFVRICDCPAAYRAPLGSVSGFGVCGALKRVVLGGILSLPGKPTAWLTFHRDVFVPPRSDCSTARCRKMALFSQNQNPADNVVGCSPRGGGGCKGVKLF